MSPATPAAPPTKCQARWSIEIECTLPDDHEGDHSGAEVTYGCEVVASNAGPATPTPEGETLREALVYARKELAASGLWHDHPTLVRIDKALASGPAVSPQPEPQGRCETTLTERFRNPHCHCDTYPTNLGPCKSWLEGGRSGYCVYCDHSLECHTTVLGIGAAKDTPQSWAVTVERDGDSVVTLSSNGMAGREISAEDETVIRTAAQHLLSFIGAVSHQPEPAREWLIFDARDRLWWKPLAKGYTANIDEAGRFTEYQAKGYERFTNDRHDIAVPAPIQETTRP